MYTRRAPSDGILQEPQPVSAHTCTRGARLGAPYRGVRRRDARGARGYFFNLSHQFLQHLTGHQRHEMIMPTLAATVAQHLVLPVIDATFTVPLLAPVEVVAGGKGEGGG